MIALEHVPLLLAQAAATLPDTVVTISASPTGLQRWVNVLTSIATILIALALIAISVALIPAAWNSRKLNKRVNELLKRVQGDLQPLIRQGHTVADNLQHITTSMRSEVDRFKGTLDTAQKRLDRASAETERRIAEFNALLQVVQQEAEDLFVDTASSLRGVKVGARTLDNSRRVEHWDEDTGLPSRPRHHTPEED